MKYKSKKIEEKGMKGSTKMRVVKYVGSGNYLSLSLLAGEDI